MDPKILEDLVKRYPTQLFSDDADGYTALTTVARLAFVNFNYSKKSADNKPLADCAIILPVSSDVSALQAISRKRWADDAVSKKHEKPKHGSPIKEQLNLADKYDGFGREGFFINAKTTQPLALFNADMTPIDAAKFYSGCYARVKVRTYIVDRPDNWGVGYGLQAVQFFGDGPKLSGFDSAAGFEKHGGAPKGNSPAAMPNGAGAAW